MRAALLLLVLLAPFAAAAHEPSESQLAVAIDGARLAGRFEVALRDLDFALGLDADGDARITWGELRARSADVAAYAFASLALDADGARCTLAPGELQVDRHRELAYAVLHYTGECPSEPERLGVDYRLFAGLDPQHRSLVRVEHAGQVQSRVLGGDAPAAQLVLGAESRWDTLRSYAREGVWHIWLGYDHLLFLLCLVLPAVLRRERGRWAPAPSLRAASGAVARIVSAFTLAHSLTLSAAVLGFVALPTRLVECAIAASVVVAALDNLRPFLPGTRWAVAFAFGLLHGFGFAGALGELGLPPGALATALFGFNLGVELGQLALVAAFLPLAFALRGSWAYRRLALGLGSAAIAGIGVVWLVERSQLLPL